MKNNKLATIILISQIVIVLFLVISYVSSNSSSNKSTERSEYIDELELKLTEAEENIRNLEEDNSLNLLKSNLKASYIAAIAQNNEISFNEQIFDAYYDTLTSNISFINDYFDEKVYLNNMYFDEYLVKAQSFSIVDIYKDTVPELAVIASPNASPNFVLIISYNSGDVVSQFYSNREMGGIKADGTFHSSGGAGNTALEEIKIGESGIEEKIFARSVSGEDGNKFYINDIEITEDKWEEVFTHQNEKEGLIWFEFPKSLYD